MQKSKMEKLMSYHVPQSRLGNKLPIEPSHIPSVDFHIGIKQYLFTSWATREALKQYLFIFNNFLKIGVWRL